MSFYADLHIHSKYSRATSRDCDLEHLSIWARKKGISLIGTGDFTHPGWLSELHEKLIPAEPGFFTLKPDTQKEIEKQTGSIQGVPTRFMLSVEISTIYKKGDRTRKVHHLIYAPSFEQAQIIINRLSRIGNLKSDGRPILGLDSRHLLEITLEAGEGAFLVPAHIWTPWFSVLGSKSGFDAVSECYGDLADHIFAVETGLSSDPLMNWRVSSLDHYRLISNSDAHSPQKLGREACSFSCELDYFSLLNSLRTGQGFEGTREFFPEEGKYHLDGHRKCGICFTPAQTKEHQGKCPRCGDPLTVGVLNRVDRLADRFEGKCPEHKDPFTSLIPLTEIVSEIEDVGVNSRQVSYVYENLLARLGPELDILCHVPVEDLKKRGSELLAEAISRMREGKVLREAGFDGEYGVIKVFSPGEIEKRSAIGWLFDDNIVKTLENTKLEKKLKQPRKMSSSQSSNKNKIRKPQVQSLPEKFMDTLDSDQRKAAEILEGPLLIIAGPGTGKTRTLTYRMANLIQNRVCLPEHCLGVTFTRRATQEMRERLESILPNHASLVYLLTFHALGLLILSEHGQMIGLPKEIEVTNDEAKRNVSLGLLTFDDLVSLAIKLLEDFPDIKNGYHQRFTWISIDEYQDIDASQYALIRLLIGGHQNVCAIGDPNQAIYRFRGADVSFFKRFEEDFPEAKVVRLKRSYRLTQKVLQASIQVIESLDEEARKLETLVDQKDRLLIHEAATEKAEAEFVVSHIEKMLGGHNFFSLDSGRSSGSSHNEYTFSDFAIFYRIGAQGNALCEAFDRSGIPYQKCSHQTLLEQPMVKEVIEQMKISPIDNSVRSRLHLASDAVLEKNPQKETGVKQAVFLLEPLAQKYGNRFPEFLQEVMIGSLQDLWDPRAQRVSLMTLHASKGLEFPVVFMVGCEDGLLPLKFGATIAPEDFNEEQRLFYVGMTRTKEKLILTRSRRRFLRGKVQEFPPSPFLLEIEDKLLEKAIEPVRKMSRQRNDSQLKLL